jgi:hypothetical protein
MATRWVLNRQFVAQPLNPDRRRWVLDSTDDAARGSHLQIAFQNCDPAAALRPGDAGPMESRPIEIRSIVEQLNDGPLRLFLIDSARGALSVSARTVSVHESPGAQYRDVLPPRPVPLAQRWLWRLLLAALRIPVVFPLVARLRRRRTNA